MFCDDITETGLLDMLRVVKIDLKGRRQTDSDDEDDGRVDIEDDDETVMEDEDVGELMMLQMVKMILVMKVMWIKMISTKQSRMRQKVEIKQKLLKMGMIQMIQMAWMMMLCSVLILTLQGYSRSAIFLVVRLSNLNLCDSSFVCLRYLIYIFRGIQVYSI